MKWSARKDAPDHRQPPRGGSLEISRRVWRGCWQVFGLAGVAIHPNGGSTNPSSRFLRKPVALRVSFLLTAAGQFRFYTGFPLTFP